MLIILLFADMVIYHEVECKSQHVKLSLIAGSELYTFGAKTVAFISLSSLSLFREQNSRRHTTEEQQASSDLMSERI